MSTPTLQNRVLSGADLRDAFFAASRHLRECAKAVDAINVYPVPDGDTGSNMSATLAEAVERTQEMEPGASAAEVLRVLAQGALYGARGNSGVILSQALRGLSSAVGDVEEIDSASLALGLQQAARSAYMAVSQPQEGTMLTVLRVAGEAAAKTAKSLPNGGHGVPCSVVLFAALRAAEEAEALTIEQMPALKEAGVPDAGGEGLCVILRGLAGAVRGEIPPVPAIPERPIAMLSGHGEDAFGFCTEFVLERTENALNLDALRTLAAAGGNSSVVVVGDENAARVHTHTDNPDALLESAGKVGTLSRVKVEDMSAQHRQFEQSGSGAGAKVAVLALSHGDGFDAIFRSLGATIFPLGEVVKPPAGEIAKAADALRRADVIVLPNHKNVLLAAQQAASLTQCTLHVVPTANLPQGIAALMTFDGGETPRENIERFEEALATVRTVEVTYSAADRRADGVMTKAGEAISLLDGHLVASGADLGDVLIAALARAGTAAGSLVTLYAGQDTSEATLEEVETRVRTAFPGAEVELVEGGQPLYPVIASVES